MSPRTQTAPVRKLESLPADTVLTGLPVATVDVTPEELSRRAPLSWSELDSELGPVLIAVIRLLDTMPRFALSSYREAPWASVTIEADGTATEADVDALLNTLRIRGSEVTDRVSVRDAAPGKAAAQAGKSKLSEATARVAPERANEPTARFASRGKHARSGRRAGPRNATPNAKTSARTAAPRAKTKGRGTRAVEALSLVKDQPGITIPELAQKMGIKQNYLYRVMPTLQQEGKVRKEGRQWHPAGHSA